MTNKKMTYAEAINEVLKSADITSEVREKLEALVNSLAKKSADRKPTAKQKENIDLKDKILEVLEILDEQVTITELCKSDDTFAEMSNQKMSALCNQLVKEEKLEKVVDKGRSYFKVKGE